MRHARRYGTRRTTNAAGPVTGRLTSSGRAHWARRSRQELARPTSSGGGVQFVLLLFVLGAIALFVIGAR